MTHTIVLSVASASFNTTTIERETGTIRAQINALAVLPTPQGVTPHLLGDAMPSDSTSSRGKSTQVLRVCQACGIEFRIIRSFALQGRGKFCSVKCRASMPIPHVPVAERFWSKVDKRGPSECWLWTGSRNRKGYGAMGVALPGRRSTTKMAHVVSYELHVSAVPEGKEIDHTCFTRNCVNPAHLEAVTHAENIRRSAARRTHCKNGHALTEDNIRVATNGQRLCKTCRQDWDRALRVAARPGTGLNAQKTHCPQGHSYDQANTYFDIQGKRTCRECGKLKAREKRRLASEKRKAA